MLKTLLATATAVFFISSAEPAFAENSACLFEDAAFDGLQLCIKGEAEVPAIRPDFNEKISSIQIEDGWQVEVCQQNNFQGPCKKYDCDVSKLGANVNDQISSYRVVREDDVEPPQACFFEHSNYQGRKFCLEQDEKWDAKTDLSLNDFISSMTVEEGLKVTVYDLSDLQGTRLTIRDDLPTVTPEWNDKISSIKVR